MSASLIDTLPVLRYAAQRTASEAGLTDEEGSAAVANAVSFLQALGEHSGLVMSPSHLVDEAWHNLILFTREYAELCERVAGRFIHHAPESDNHDLVGLSPAESFAFLESNGYRVDKWLWLHDGDGVCDGGCDGGGGGGGGRCDGGCDGS